MKIFVDADSCPVKVRNVISRASLRKEIVCTFVSNSPIPLEKHKFIFTKITEKVDGSADDYIVETVEAGDLVITRDIPLADRLIKKDCIVINDRGFEFTKNNIAERLSERNFMKTFYENGIIKQSGKSYDKKELAQFANCFDRILTKLCR